MSHAAHIGCSGFPYATLFVIWMSHGSQFVSAAPSPRPRCWGMVRAGDGKARALQPLSIGFPRLACPPSPRIIG